MTDNFTASEGLTLADLKGLIDPWVEEGCGDMAVVRQDESGDRYHLDTVAIKEGEIVLS